MLAVTASQRLAHWLRYVQTSADLRCAVSCLPNVSFDVCVCGGGGVPHCAGSAKRSDTWVNVGFSGLWTLVGANADSICAADAAVPHSVPHEALFWYGIVTAFLVLALCPACVLIRDVSCSQQTAAAAAAAQSRLPLR